MAIKAKELKEIKKAVEHSHRPLIFFDDDCDGLSSFLQIYKVAGEGRGVPVKDSPEVGERYARKAEEIGPDTIFIVDKPMANQDFLDQLKQPTYWIDHHEPQSPKGVHYYNPRVHKDKDNQPTSYWLYKALKKNLWIAALGTIADWHFPKDLVKEFRKEYPELLPKDIKTAPAAIHDTKLGELIRIVSFNLKGNVSDTMASVKTLTRINDPYEILNQTSSRGKFLYKKYERMADRYKELYDSIKVPEDKLLVFTYTDDGTSYTSDLSNEVLYRHPDKVIIIGRLDNGKVKSSVRSTDVDVATILKECLEGVNGYGGGHTNACGCCVDQEDWDKFISCFKSKL